MFRYVILIQRPDEFRNYAQVRTEWQNLSAPLDQLKAAGFDRLSRETTDLLMIARDIQKAGAGLRSLAEPVLRATGEETCKAIGRSYGVSGATVSRFQE